MQILENTSYRLSELAILFFLLPISLYFDFNLGLKVGMILTAVVYVIVISVMLKHFNPRTLFGFTGFKYWKNIAFYFSLIAVGSYLFMQHKHPDKLFIAVKTAPLFWIGLVLFYSLFSVYPQEFLYRAYFFKRYNGVLSKNMLIGLNVIAFPVAHLFFHSWLVVGVTLIGGVLFTLSYTKTKSLMLTTVEHAIYGSWLFTIGMGEMLGFPLPTP